PRRRPGQGTGLVAGRGAAGDGELGPDGAGLGRGERGGAAGAARPPRGGRRRGGFARRPADRLRPRRPHGPGGGRRPPRAAGHPAGAVSAVAFSPTESLLASAGSDGVLRLWDTVTWRLRDDRPRHAGAVRALAFSPDGRLLASAGHDWTVRLWRPASGEEAFTL